MYALANNSLIELLVSIGSFLRVGKYEKATVFDPDPNRVPRPKAKATPGAPERSAHKWSVGVHNSRVSAHIRLCDHATRNKANDRNAWTTVIIAFGNKLRECVSLEKLVDFKGMEPISEADYDFIYPQVLPGFERDFCESLQSWRQAKDAISKAKGKLPKVATSGSGSSGFVPTEPKEEKVPGVIEFYHGAIKNRAYPGYKWAGKTAQDLWDFIGEHKAIVDAVEKEWTENTNGILEPSELFRALELGLWESARIPEGWTWEGQYKPETKSILESTAKAAKLEEFSYKGKKAYRGPRQVVAEPQPVA